MNSEEIQSLIEQLKAQGLSEEEIMDTFYQTFVDGKMDRKDLETLADAMGYELTDEFKNEATPDPIEAGAPAEGMSEEALEDVKAIEPGESEEEFKEKIEDVKEGEEEPEKSEEKPEAEEDEEEKPEESEEEEKSEDEEWEEANKYFKLND